MNINIPYMPKDKTGALHACIKAAAAETHSSPYLVAVIMSKFFEELCEQTANNRPVYVPSVGVFAARNKRSRKNGEVFCKPDFSPSKAFMDQVRLQCSPLTGAAKLDIVRRHKLHTRKRDNIRMTWRAQRDFREKLRKQAENFGIVDINET